MLRLTPRQNLSGSGACLGLALALAILLLAGGLPASAQSQLKFATKNVDDGTLGLPYKSRIQMSGGAPPYKWQLGGGTSLPPGLVLKKFKGKIVGTPTALGTFTFTVRVTDSAGSARSRDFTITIGDTTELVELISVSTTGTVANSDSGGAALSPDGRFVAFTSFASNLVTGDKNAQPDIFLRDRACGTTTLVSVSTAGIQAKSQSFAPWVSSVGSTVFVAYASDAANLVNLVADDTNKTRDIFVTALDFSGCPPTVVNTERVSVGVDSIGDPIQGKGLSNLPVISADGRFVAYQSLSANLVEGDGNGAFDIFITEIQFSGGVTTALRTQRVNTRKLPLGAQLELNLADTLADIFGNKTIGNAALTMTPDEHVGRMVKMVAGTGVGQGRLIESNNATSLTLSTAWAINPDATSVFRIATREKQADIFSASTLGHTALNMTAGEHVGRQVEIGEGKGRGQTRLITAHDATTLTVAPDWDPVPDDTSVFRVILLGDHTVDFADERNLVNFNLASFINEHVGRLLEIVSGTGAGQVRTILGNDPISFFVDTAWDPIPDNTSVFRLFSEGAGNSFRPRLTPDGSLVAFHSGGALASDDTNVTDDIYLSDPATGITLLQSVDDAGTVANGPSQLSGVNGDGDLILFQSGATKLVLDDDNLAFDLFLHDRLSGTTTRVSLANDGSEGNGSVDVAAGLSGGGRLVAFSSFATNLVTDDRNGTRDVFLRDLLAPSTTRLSLGMGGINPNGQSLDAALSLDGTTIAFTSDAKNLVANDTNKVSDIFVVTTGISDPPMIVTSSLPAPRQGSPYSASLGAVGGAPPLFWTLTEGALPPGVFLDPSTGTISGLPQKPGSYSFTVMVMDSDRPTRQASRALTLLVKP